VDRLSCESGEHRQLLEVLAGIPTKTLRTHILPFAISQRRNAISKNPASMSSSPWRAESKYVQILKFGHVLGELCVPENTRQSTLGY